MCGMTVQVVATVRQAFLSDTDQKQPSSLTPSRVRDSKQNKIKGKYIFNLVQLLCVSFILSHVCTQPRRSQQDKLVECVKALALCHNVTPVVEDEREEEEEGEGGERVKLEEEEVVIFHSNTASTSRKISYQAYSPDEVMNCSVH